MTIAVRNAIAAPTPCHNGIRMISPAIFIRNVTEIILRIFFRKPWEKLIVHNRFVTYRNGSEQDKTKMVFTFGEPYLFPVMLSTTGIQARFSTKPVNEATMISIRTNADTYSFFSSGLL